MTDLSLPSTAAVGDLLDGRYRLDAVIGSGGMASVFRATDETLGRTVAVKVFRAGAADPADDARRESEKTLLATLSHPSLVTLFDAQLSDVEHAYLVMEYIDGGTLESRIGSGVISSLDAASLAADLGEALHVVHSAGIVHRDIKPTNILLRPPLAPQHTFRAVLADFGIAYLVDSARVTTPGMTMGTAAYIAPEQVRGAQPTPASDIYSLGLVLLESLTGRRAFAQRSPHEALAARLVTSPEIPGSLGYGWRSLLTAMTALDPAARPTALEVASRGQALDDFRDAPGLTGLATGPIPDAAAASLGTVTGHDTTRVLPPHPSAPTGPAASAGLSASEAPSGDVTSADDGRTARRRWRALVGGTLAVLGVIVVGTMLWLVPQPEPPAPPTLPQVDEPLNSHLEDLLEQVTP